MERLIAIGDIHGCVHTLRDLLHKVDYSSKTDVLVFLGDYIDRGLFSREVVSALMDMQKRDGTDAVVCLRGNHEQMAIDAYRRGNYSLWYRNGGAMTERSFDDDSADIGEAVSWFETLPLVYETPEIIFCHAGLTYPALKDNSPSDLLWGRDWLYTDTQVREKQVVFGHTPSRNNLAYSTNTGDICIDAACVYGGCLCAMVLREDGIGAFLYADKNRMDN